MPAPWWRMAIMPFFIGGAGALVYRLLGDWGAPPETRTLCTAAGVFG